MKNPAVKRIVMTALFSAAALVSFMIENLFPPLFVPGARLGISNVFTLLAVICLGIKEGFAVLLVKILLGSLFSGNASAVIYSLPSGIISLTAEVALLTFTKKISVVSVSTLGGSLNLTVQNAIFCLIAGGEYLIYLPYLSAIGALSGAFVGFAVYLIVGRIPKRFTD